MKISIPSYSEGSKTYSIAFVLQRLKSMAHPESLEGMSRFGIKIDKALGIKIPHLRKLAKELGKHHDLALELWESGLHEARILASMVDEPAKVTKDQTDGWIKGFDSWDLCDQVCMNLFSRLPFAFDKAAEWAERRGEFERRAGFALMASLAHTAKEVPDKQFVLLFPLIQKYATDNRNYAKKAINWALRQIGKRNKYLCQEAIKLAKEIATIDSKAARWVASDALRELQKHALHTDPDKSKNLRSR